MVNFLKKRKKKRKRLWEFLLEFHRIYRSIILCFAFFPAVTQVKAETSLTIESSTRLLTTWFDDVGGHKGLPSFFWGRFRGLCFPDPLCLQSSAFNCPSSNLPLATPGFPKTLKTQFFHKLLPTKKICSY